MGSNGDGDGDGECGPASRAGARSSASEFHEEVAAGVRRIDPSAWERRFVVGDVHGCLTELRRLVDTLGVGPSDLLLFVGDLVAKGPDSSGVVEFVRDRPNACSIRGNTEHALLTGEKDLDSLDGSALEYLASLSIGIRWAESLLVHGGIDPTRPLHSQDVESLLTCRSIPPENGYDGPFWFESTRDRRESSSVTRSSIAPSSPTRSSAWTPGVSTAVS